jgi:hypothetical protein
MTTRVLMKGHDAVSLEGTLYTPDELGVFEVPDHLAPVMITQWGGTIATNLVNEAEQKLRADAAAEQKAKDDLAIAEAQRVADEAAAAGKKKK